MKTAKRWGVLFVSGVLLCQCAWAQRAVDPRVRYERLVCIVPMVGAGTAEDPRRPMYTPAGPREATPFLAVSYLASDDGNSALVEFVAVDRSAFDGILQDRDARVKKFEKGKVKREDVEAEFRKYRKNVDLRHFGARVQ